MRPILSIGLIALLLCTAGCTADGAAGNEHIHQPSCMEIDPVPHGIAATVGDAAYGTVDCSAAADMDDIALRAPVPSVKPPNIFLPR